MGELSYDYRVLARCLAAARAQINTAAASKMGAGTKEPFSVPIFTLGTLSHYWACFPAREERLDDLLELALAFPVAIEAFIWPVTERGTMAVAQQKALLATNVTAEIVTPRGALQRWGATTGSGD